MRKGLVVLLAAVVVAMFAVPAMAGMEASGFYRAKGYLSNFKNASATSPAIGKDAPSNAYVEQRFRLKLSFGDENVKAVFFTENDIGQWGDIAGNTNSGTPATGASRNAGGALGGDRINTEIKNTFVWFKLPDTTFDFTVGLQNQSDAYAGLLFGAADMAGIFVNGKFDPVTLRLGWAKLYENNVAKADDMTLYIASVGLNPTKELKVGLNFYMLQDDTQKVSVATQLPSDPGANLEKTRVYVPGIDVAFNAGPATISGFLLYQTGTVEDLVAPAVDIDIKGYAVDLRGDMNLGPGKFFVEGLYVSGGDGSGTDYESIVTLSDGMASPGGNSFFARTDMSILLVNADDINTSQALVGAAASASSPSPSNGGRGIMHIAAGYSQKLTEKVTGKVGVGYLRASEMLVTDAATRDEEMGTEINANVNYNIMKGLDFGLYGAYAFLGDFFKLTAATDNDDAYDLHFRLNYAF